MCKGDGVFFQRLIAGNERVLHDVILRIRETKNFSEDFGPIFDEFFPSQSSKNRLIYLQFYEALFVSILADRYKFNISKVNLLKEDSSLDFGLNLFGLTVHTSEIGNSKDIPIGAPVLCSNAEFSAFTLAAFSALNMEDSFERMIIIRYVTGKIQRIFEIIKNDPIFLHGRRNIAYQYVLDIQRKIMKEYTKYSHVRVQIHELVGMSGIGKSRAVLALANIVAAMCPFIRGEDLIFVRPNDYWWSGYQGQPIILYDDFTHIKKKMKFDLPFELISIASGTMRHPPMAFAKDTLFTSTLVVVTSNIPIITTVGNSETVKALKRRIVSGVWSGLEGTIKVENKLVTYLFKGRLHNTIKCGNRLVYSLFKESIEIYNSETQIELEFSDGLEGIIYEEEEEESYSDPFSKLTSSVPESYSAIIENGDCPEGTVVSAAHKNELAQVNQLLAGKAMFSNVVASATAYVPAWFQSKSE